MTGSTDPALRAAVEEYLSDKDPGWDKLYGRKRLRAALAAAEAAPPTDPDIEAHVAAIVEQYGGAFDALAAHDSAEAAPLDVFDHGGCNTCQMEPGKYARLPDTETAGEES